MRTLVVIPTFNEVDNVRPLAREVLDLDAGRDPGLEILFVDDNSPDGTPAAVEELAAGESRIHALIRPSRLGLGSAYLAGFDFALERDFTSVVTMDADFSHPPRYLPALIAALEDSDIVVGSRYVKGGGVKNWGLTRRILSRAANFYTRFLLWIPTRDCTAGLRAYRAEALRRLPLDGVLSSGYAALEELMFLAHRAGFSISEVPIIFEGRRIGESKITHREILHGLCHVPLLRIRSLFGVGSL